MPDVPDVCFTPWSDADIEAATDAMRRRGDSEAGIEAFVQSKRAAPPNSAKDDE